MRARKAVPIKLFITVREIKSNSSAARTDVRSRDLAWSWCPTVIFSLTVIKMKSKLIDFS